MTITLMKKCNNGGTHSGPFTGTVKRAAEARLPTEYGEFRIIGYRSRVSDEEFVVLARGELDASRSTLVRIHSQCLTGDVFGSTKCDCGQQLNSALKLIADEPRHGYDLIRAVEDMTGGEYAPSPGIVYPTLTMLDEMGLIEERKSKDSKKVFAATEEGRVHLDENLDQVEELIERLTDMRPPERSDAGPAISRAVKNLMTAMTQRVSRGGFDQELLHEIAAILDDAAQRIERVK